MLPSHLVLEVRGTLINVIAETRPVVMIFMFLDSVTLKNVVELREDAVRLQNAF